MINIGEFATLEVSRSVDFGFYLNGGPLGEILLPGKYAPSDLAPGGEINVFIYCDSEDRLIATTEKPKAVLNDFALLTVKDTNDYGAFLDWGLLKDLLVPYREQRVKMKTGNAYLVRICLDEKTDRLIGSSRLNRFLKETSDAYSTGDEVDIIVAVKTELGWKVVVDQKYWGMLYDNEIFQKLKEGDQFKAYIKLVRPDQKLDISLQKQGYQQIENTTDRLQQALIDANGFLPITDKSPPEEIYQTLQMSKKAFKKAVGNLFKQRIIILEKNGIRMVKDEQSKDELRNTNS